MRARSCLPGLWHSRPAAMGVAGKANGRIQLKRSKNTRPYAVYVVEGEGEVAFWAKIGAAWPHEDGKRFHLQLSAMRFTGRIALREPKEREKEPEANPPQVEEIKRARAFAPARLFRDHAGLDSVFLVRPTANSADVRP